MKKGFLFAIVAIVTFLLAGCFESTEDISINRDGSGTYTVNLNMGGMFDFMEMMKAMDTSANNKKEKQKFDSTIQMRTFTDTAAKLTAEQKTLLKDATIRVVMDEAEKVFNIKMNYPFSQVSDVQKLMELNQSGNSAGLLSQALKGSADNALEAPQMEGSDMPDIGSYYNLTFSDKLIERKVNEEKIKALQSDSKFGDMQQAEQMLKAITMNTVLHLPRRVKKAEGTRVQLSADKKTVTINATLLDVFKNPQSLAYKVVY